MPLPLIKLGVLLAKQVSKPIVNRLKIRARANPILRKIFIQTADCE
jgi:hypothetical protein